MLAYEQRAHAPFYLLLLEEAAGRFISPAKDCKVAGVVRAASHNIGTFNYRCRGT